MIYAVVSAATVPVEDGGEIGKIAVQVDVLGISPSTCPSVKQRTLKDLRQ